MNFKTKISTMIIITAVVLIMEAIAIIYLVGKLDTAVSEAGQKRKLLIIAKAERLNSVGLQNDFGKAEKFLPALQKMQQDLHTTSAWAQSTLTMWFIGSAAFQLVMGVLSDRYGRRPVLLLGGCIFILATRTIGFNMC